MAKAPIRINEHFVVITDENGNEIEIIYNPPLLAESENIRIELRKEEKHNRPHVHILKKGNATSFEISIALDSLNVLAGKEKLKHFAERELKKIGEFLAENADRFKEIYENLRGDL